MPTLDGKALASVYIDKVLKLIFAQLSIMELIEKENLDPTVWESIGEGIKAIHGEDAYKCFPLLLLSIDIYLYSIDKLSEEEFHDVITRMDEFVQTIKGEINEKLLLDKKKGGDWVH